MFYWWLRYATYSTSILLQLKLPIEFEQVIVIAHSQIVIYVWTYVDCWTRLDTKRKYAPLMPGSQFLIVTLIKTPKAAYMRRRSSIAMQFAYYMQERVCLVNKQRLYNRRCDRGYMLCSWWCTIYSRYTYNSSCSREFNRL